MVRVRAQPRLKARTYRRDVFEDAPLLEDLQRTPVRAPADVRIEKEERSEVLLAALEQLGSISRDTIVLRDFQGMSHEEMAALDGVAIGTVKSRISRARTDLARAVLKLERGEKRQVRHGMS